MHSFLYFLNGIIFFRHCQISKMFLFFILGSYFVSLYVRDSLEWRNQNCCRFQARNDNKPCTFLSKYLIYKGESIFVCMYVRRPASGPTQPITPKFGMGSSFYLGLAPSQGATQNVGPQPRPQPHPLLLISSLDQFALEYFTIVL